MTSSKNSVKVIAVAAFAAFLATFNETYMNVAFTPIMNDLGISANTVQWLATAYMLGAAVMVPVSAFLYRSFKTKNLFLTTLTFLILGSAIGALANNFPMLLAGRIIQSIGTGMLIPIGMNITLETAPREKLGLYMGIMGSMTTLGPSVSVIAAGALLSAGTWHTMLWVFAGLSLLCFIMGAAFLGNIAHLTHPRLDKLSVTLIGLALIGIMYGVSTAFGMQQLFLFKGDISLVSVILGVILLVLFLKRQGKLQEPLINLQPLSFKPFSIGVSVNILGLIVIFAMNIVMPMFLQMVRGASPMQASLTLFPAILMSCFMAPIAGKIYDKHGIRIMLPLGFFLIGIFALLLTIFKEQSLILLAVLYIPVICGNALIIGPVQSFMLSRLPRALNPHGVTVMSTGFQIAGCFGSSLFIGVFSLILGMNMAKGAAFPVASSAGFVGATYLALAVAVIGFILAMILRHMEIAEMNEAIEEAKPKTLRSLMKTEIYSIADTASVMEAVQTIVEKKVSGLPVVNAEGNLVGVISDSQVIRAFANCHPLFANAYAANANLGEESIAKTLPEFMGKTVADVMKKDIVTVDVNSDLGEVCWKMLNSHLKKIPVTENGKMVGIINRSNITKFAMKTAMEAAKPAEQAW